MSNLIPGNGKHLTLKDRTDIEVELNKGTSFSKIAKLLCKDPSTISREVFNHRLSTPNNAYNRSLNHCMLKDACKRQHVCEKCFRSVYKGMSCKSCKRCNTNCKHFIQEYCETVKYAPFVCNACSKTKKCRFTKYFYKATSANRLYKEKLVESRQGINISEKELLILDELIKPLIMQGQSPYLICANNKADIPVSPRTIYRYIELNALSIKNIDLSRKVRYKPRKQIKELKAIDKGIYIGRTYEDFIEYSSLNSDLNIVEMDTVIGNNKSNKVLLTLFFRNCKFMMAYLLDKKTASNVIAIFDTLEEKLSKFTFKLTFPIILTDRGSEFMRPDEIEISKDNDFKTNIFYCNPQAPYQKGCLEKNHEYIRYILPKGTSFDNLSQEKVELMLSHINSTKRASLNGLSPFQLASQLLPKKALQVFNIKYIEPNNIILKPDLLK